MEDVVQLIFQSSRFFHMPEQTGGMRSVKVFKAQGEKTWKHRQSSELDFQSITFWDKKIIPRA